MIALLSAGGALRDVFLSLGVGLFTALFYSVLKAILGTKRLQAILCDFLTFVFAGVLFRSAAIGVFEGGIMRWYTAAGAIISYILFVVFALPTLMRKISAEKQRANAVFERVKKPFYMFACKFLVPHFSAFKANIKNILCKMRKIRTKRTKNKKTHLQTQGKVLYNA